MQHKIGSAEKPKQQKKKKRRAEDDDDDDDDDDEGGGAGLIVGIKYNAKRDDPDVRPCMYVYR